MNKMIKYSLVLIVVLGFIGQQVSPYFINKMYDLTPDDNLFLSVIKEQHKHQTITDSSYQAINYCLDSTKYDSLKTILFDIGLSDSSKITECHFFNLMGLYYYQFAKDTSKAALCLKSHDTICDFSANRKIQQQFDALVNQLSFSKENDSLLQEYAPIIYSDTIPRVIKFYILTEDAWDKVPLSNRNRKKLNTMKKFIDWTQKKYILPIMPRIPVRTIKIIDKFSLFKLQRSTIANIQVESFKEYLNEKQTFQKITTERSVRTQAALESLKYQQQETQANFDSYIERYLDFENVFHQNFSATIPEKYRNNKDYIFEISRTKHNHTDITLSISNQILERNYTVSINKITELLEKLSRTIHRSTGFTGANRSIITYEINQDITFFIPDETSKFRIGDKRNLTVNEVFDIVNQKVRNKLNKFNEIGAITINNESTLNIEKTEEGEGGIYFHITIKAKNIYQHEVERLKKEKEKMDKIEIIIKNSGGSK